MPYAKEFEVEVLRALLDPAFYARWSRALPLSLFTPHGQKVVRAIFWCHRAHKDGKRIAVTLPDILAALRREGDSSPKVTELAKLLALKNPPNISVQQALAQEAIQRAALEELVRQAIVQQSTGKINLDALRGALRVANSNTHGPKRFDPKSIVGDLGKLKPLPTPWPAINEQIEGGLYPKELGMVMATPKIGKTTMLLNLAAEALDRGFYLLYVTAADQGYSDIARRMAGVWLDTPASLLRGNAAALEAAFKGWTERGGTFCVADYAARPCHMSDIERDIEVSLEESQGHPVAVIIDRLERVPATGQSAGDRWGILASFEEARMLAHRCAVPIWCDSQASLPQQRKDGSAADDGWVNITRGAESRVGKAATVDLFLGVGTHPEDENTIRVNVQGRREIVNHRFELRKSPRSGVVKA